MTNTNEQKIITALSEHPLTETQLSKKSGIPLSELRLILGELSTEGVIEHMGKLIWLTSQADEFCRLDMTKVQGMKNLVGAYWKDEKNREKLIEDILERRSDVLRRLK